jgi:hypothetical protein
MQADCSLWKASSAALGWRRRAAAASARRPGGRANFDVHQLIGTPAA